MAERCDDENENNEAAHHLIASINDEFNSWIW